MTNKFHYNPREMKEIFVEAGISIDIAEKLVDAIDLETFTSLKTIAKCINQIGTGKK